MTSFANHSDAVCETGSALPRLDHVKVLVLFGGIPLHGQERANIEVIRNMVELGVRAKLVTHAARGHEAVQPELTRQGLDWTTAPYGPLLGRNLFGKDVFRIFYGIVTTSWVIWRELRRWRPTHLYVLNPLYISYGFPAVFLSRLPMIYRLGDCPAQHTFLHRLLWKLICQRTNVMVCNSGFIDKMVAASSGKPEVTKVIFNLPPKRTKNVAAKLPASAVLYPNAQRLIYVGQIAESKGVPILVSAVRHLLDQGCDIVLWLVGDYSWNYPMAKALIEELRKVGLDHRIQFLGYQENVSAFFQAADIHVCPSIEAEASPNVVLEAKAAGIPSVVFPNGGLPELVEHKIDGFLCSGKNVRALEEGILHFVSNLDVRKNAGEAARRNLEKNFGNERFKRQWADVFLQSCAKSIK